MTQPFEVNMAPSPDQLRLAAQALLADAESLNTRMLARSNVSTLLDLLIRLRLYFIPGPRRRASCLRESDVVSKELADNIANEVACEDRVKLTRGRIGNIACLLVSC